MYFYTWQGCAWKIYIVKKGTALNLNPVLKKVEQCTFGVLSKWTHADHKNIFATRKLDKTNENDR